MSMSRFDLVVWGVALLLISLIILVIRMGDQVGLGIIQLIPEQNAGTVSTRSQIRITFGDVIESIPETAVTLSPHISGTTKVNGNTLIFQPETPFAPDTDYEVTLAPGITGAKGRDLKESLIWQFHTTQPRVLFIKPDENGPEQLYVAEMSGETAPQQLTQSASSIIDYAVSPDGSKIAYSAMTDDLDLTATSDLWLMNADGSDQKMILECTDAACNRPVWLPDGRRLIYERRNIPTPGVSPGNPRLWWTDVFTGETVRIFQDSQLLGLFATVSPDGRWFSFVSPTEQGIQIYNIEEGTSIFVPNQVGAAATWSPDSQNIALANVVTSDLAWSTGLSTLSISSRESQMLTEGFESDDYNPVWSPDGEQIAFGRKRSSTAMGRQIWVMQADGTAANPITADTDIHHGELAWSPDGRYILYQQYNLTEQFAQPGIGIVDTETGQATDIAYPAMQPAWLP